jgi:hypothetical protein
MHFSPILGYEGSYEVSQCGQVRSLDRVVIGADKVAIPKWGKLLTPYPHKDTRYLQVNLWKENKGTSFYVHRLVAQAYIPNPKQLPEVNHKDGNRQNNDVGNLEWVDSLGNKLHAIRTGLRTYTNKLTRQEFLDCLNDVISGESYADVCLRVPYKVPFLSVKLRKLARETGLENELDNSLMDQRIKRARINGAKNY